MRCKSPLEPGHRKERQRTVKSRLTSMSTYLGTRKHNLAGDEDEQHDLRLDHAVDQAGEELRANVSTKRAQRRRARTSGS